MYHCVCGECNIFIGISFEIKNRNCPKCGTKLQYVDYRIYEMWKNARIDEKKYLVSMIVFLVMATIIGLIIEKKADSKKVFTIGVL